jgi:hypothetical protein
MEKCHELFRAIKQEDFLLVKETIEDLNIDNCIIYLYPILTHAVFSGNIEIVRLLLDRKSNINIQNSKGYAPLHGAVDYNFYPIVQLLLENGAIPDVQDEFGYTPLWNAVFSPKYNIKIIELLVNCGADPDLKNVAGSSPKSHAERIKAGDIIALFK